MRNLIRELLGRRNHQRTLTNSFVFGFVVNLSIDLGNTVRDFKISGTHVYSSTFDFSNLDLSDQLLSNLLVKIPYKAKSSTGFGKWISNDLRLFDFAKLLKMASKTLVREIVV